jgi:hypothetical protein
MGPGLYRLCCVLCLCVLDITLSLTQSTLYNSLITLASIYLYFENLFDNTHINKHAFLHICRRCLRFDLCVRCCSGLEPGSRLRCTFSYSFLHMTVQLMYLHSFPASPPPSRAPAALSPTQSASAPPAATRSRSPSLPAHPPAAAPMT